MQRRSADENRRREAIVDAATMRLRRVADVNVDVGVVLGSGLGRLIEVAEEVAAVSTGELIGFPRSTVRGHEGRIVIGKVGGLHLAFVQGRVHAYEGVSPWEATVTIRLLAKLGISRLVVTNAAGSLRREWQPGQIVLLTDHINFAQLSPLSGVLDDGPRFTDMSNPYDMEWVYQAESVALRRAVRTERGTYLYTLGPSYETPAEIRVMRRLGADVVGMSTVPEVIVANRLGLRVLGISLVTNLAAGLSQSPLNHQEVVEVGNRVRGKMVLILQDLIEGLANES